MKYALGTANGDAGEFFAAYKIAKELGWPCRLFDIDIGIDAQVEILTDSRESTGRFVALQVKAFSTEETDCRYVKKRQLLYWRSLEIPVFVALVDLKNERMFLHLVDTVQEYETTRAGLVKIIFDLEKDKFSSASKARFSEASERVGMLHINQYLNPVNTGIERILRSVQHAQDSYPDPQMMIEYMEERSTLFGLLAQADAACALSKFGNEAIAKCRNSLSWSLHDLQNAMTPMEYDYADQADISSFLRERYISRPDFD